MKNLGPVILLSKLSLRAVRLLGVKGGAENAGVENAGVENAGVDRTDGKCMHRSDNVWKAVKQKIKILNMFNAICILHCSICSMQSKKIGLCLLIVSRYITSLHR